MRRRTAAARQNNLFGYNKVDGRLEIVEPEAAVVREVFERYAAGELGLRAIANDLDSRGIRGRQGKPLTYSTLYGMIRNPKYKGCYAGRRYASRDYRDKRSYRLSADKWLVHKDDRVPAIVPEALWEQANHLLASRGKTMKAHAQASQNRYATAASSSARSTAQLSTGMCIKAKAAARRSAGTVGCTVKRAKPAAAIPRRFTAASWTAF